MAVQEIDTPAELAAFASQHGMRSDWHEPDEQGIHARIIGNHLDNAMSPRSTPARTASGEDYTEYNVVLQSENGNGTRSDVAVVNLATLLSWAAGAREPEVEAV